MDGSSTASSSIKGAFTGDIEKLSTTQSVEVASQTDQVQGNVLAKKLKSRHMGMIAIGGCIGAGLFVASGLALRTGGPGSLLLAFLVAGIMVICTIQALGELAVLYPVNGAFYTYAVRFISPSIGFAMGHQYALSWLTVLPFELTVASLTIDFWQSHVPPAVWIAAFLVLLVIIQCFGVRGYAEVEFALSLMKLLACLGFIIFGIVVDVGGVPTDNRGFIGAQYWHNPGAFHNGFKGFVTVFVTAMLAYAGTELVGLAAAEATDPAVSLPRATKLVFWRVAVFYLTTLFILGLILPSNDSRLMGASGANTKASPFVLAIQMAGVKGLPSVFNAVICMSAISVANSSTFASSRCLQALAANGMAPRFFSYIDKAGRPLWCLVLQLLVGCIAFVRQAPNGDQVFSWLLSLTALSFIFAWGAINLAHIRFRHGWSSQGYSVSQLPYRAMFGIYGSYMGLALCAMGLIAIFFISVSPLNAQPSAVSFFQSFLAAPIFIAFYLFWKFYSHDKALYVRAKDMDVTTGLRPGWDAVVVKSEQNRGFWRRVLSLFI